MPATGGNTTTAAAGTGSNGVAESMALRACSTSGCRVSKFVEVTKRKCSQFVSEPYIMAKPLVVHGKTSIFQVGGEMAKLGDIPSLASKTGSGSVSGDGQPIYRIKPGTHAHVINYVFIDEGSDSMEKAKSEDQEAMRMLLNSQRESATAKLQKLISTHLGGGQTNAVATTAPASAATATATATTSATVAAAVASTNSNLTSIPTNNVNVTTPQIHPDLSIASVAGALPLTASLSPAPSAAVSKTTTTTAVQAKRATTVTAKADNSVQNLQAEILKLRRTVARLNGNAPR